MFAWLPCCRALLTGVLVLAAVPRAEPRPARDEQDKQAEKGPGAARKVAGRFEAEKGPSILLARQPDAADWERLKPGVVHSAKGRVRVLVVGIPDIADDDMFFP